MLLPLALCLSSNQDLHLEINLLLPYTEEEQLPWALPLGF